MHPRLPKTGLYAITDGPRTDLFGAVEGALKGGVAMLQYRDKTPDAIRRRDEARALRTLCTRFGVPLIINDDVALAREIDADGVHLGEDDSDVIAARSMLGAMRIIGASCYDSMARARDLAAAGVDYLAFGAFYPSPTKPQARRATLGLLTEAKALGLPLVAIGGITSDNVRPLVEAGADFVAVITDIFGASDPTSAAARYRDAFLPRRDASGSA